MNLKIKKFWEDAGYTVSENCEIPVGKFAECTYWCISWTAIKDNQVELIAISNAIKGDAIDGHELNYKIVKDFYSEEQALRLINMKTFL